VTLPASTRPSTRARRQEILDIATTVFAEKGIVATSMRDISERVGIFAGSLYHHFASKEEMISEILAPVVASQFDGFHRIVASTDDPREVLRLLIAAAIAQTATNPAVARILRQDEHHIRDLAGLDEVVQQRRALRSGVETVIEAGIRAGQFRSDCDPRVTSMAYFDMVLGAYRHLTPIGNLNTSQVTDELTTLILRGLATR
jgi:TetR/AcrR family transcriptional regulator, cholesterol catabolism regulator